ncbi:hypothetical protein [Nocardioides sp.]|uniref:hypothetical protein n=1 Tax=Nocardioides sp. TaxID=35761 RepID=UPI002BD49F9F|nr:hypothetical protein [Nocardioides sp.]HXH79532.1 hypothetical protein [Nocardioides sp.]
MNEPYITAERAVELVRWWAPRLGLAHWQISVAMTDDPEKPSGACWISDRYSAATLHLSSVAATNISQHDHDAETTLVHELLHIANRSQHDEIARVYRQYVPKPERNLAWKRYDLFHEGGIEQVARALVLTRHGLPDEMMIPVIGATP